MYLAHELCLGHMEGLLCVHLPAVKQEDLKLQLHQLVTLHVVDKTQLEGTYTGRVARALDVLMLCAGYGGQMVYDQFVNVTY